MISLLSANYVPLTPLSFLERSVDVYPQATAVIRDGGQQVSYVKLLERSLRLAAGLRASGVATGDRVAVLAPNSLPVLEAHYGIPGAGGIVVALNTRLSPSEYGYILRHSRARVLLVDSSLVGQLSAIEGLLPDLRLVLVVDADDGQSRVDGEDYESWLDAAQPAAGLEHPKDELDPIAVNYTSGTTGRPKGAVYTHRGAYLNSLGQVLEMGMRQSSVYLWTLPMFHCNGWTYTWAVTAVGGQHVCLRRFEPNHALELIEEHRVTHFCAAPVVLSSIADAAGTVRDFDRHITAATGGAPPSPTVIGQMQSIGIEVVHLYGLTETYGPSIICEPQPDWRELSNSAVAERVARQGVRTINVEEVRVVDHLKKDVIRNGEDMGEIVIRSNTVMLEYLDAEDTTSEAFEDGWFHTGDLAVVHPDGYIEIRDRAKDIIISGGENISSIQVENVLVAHPSVSEAAVVAAPNERWGEVPIAYVALKSESQATEEELIEWSRERLAHFKAPVRVIFGDLPKTSTGKIQKNLLRALGESGDDD